MYRGYSALPEHDHIFATTLQHILHFKLEIYCSSFLSTYACACVFSASLSRRRLPSLWLPWAPAVLIYKIPPPGLVQNKHKQISPPPRQICLQIAEGDASRPPLGFNTRNTHKLNRQGAGWWDNGANTGRRRPERQLSIYGRSSRWEPGKYFPPLTLSKAARKRALAASTLLVGIRHGPSCYRRPHKRHKPPLPSRQGPDWFPPPPPSASVAYPIKNTASCPPEALEMECFSASQNGSSLRIFLQGL